MADMGGILYVLFFLLAAWMWRRCRGLSVEQIIERDTREHHRVHAVFVSHPQGGSWGQFRRWMKDASRSD